MVSVIVLASGAVLVLVIAILCANGVLPRNRGVGLRIPALMASDESWRAGHRAAILPSAVGALASVIATIVVLVQPSLQSIGPLVLTITLVVPLIWATFRANHVARA